MRLPSSGLTVRRIQVGSDRLHDVDVRTVDPRDQTWALTQPRYRVHFHDSNGVQEEFEVAGADVDEVLSWAQHQAAGRAFVVYACISGDGLGLVRLLGRDPDAH